MVKTSRGRRSDVHTGALANGFQTFEDLDLFRTVFLILILIHKIKPPAAGSTGRNCIFLFSVKQ
jgi:hypothetical protein